MKHLAKETKESLHIGDTIKYILGVYEYEGTIIRFDWRRFDSIYIHDTLLGYRWIKYPSVVRKVEDK